MPRDEAARPGMPVTWSQVHAFRIARHHLDAPVPRSQLAEAVADACGIQAQVMAAAQLALRVRVRNLALEDVERALWRDRSVARVWSVRGTVHLVPAKEFAVFVRGPSTRQVARFEAWLRRSRADPQAVEQIVSAATSAMDRPRTRADLAICVHESLGWPIEHRGSRGWGSPQDAPGFRLGRSVVTIPDVAWVASYRGLACFGPDNGDGSTFVRPDAWLPGFRDLPLEAAEDALLRRYLGSFGPATVSDFSTWSVVAMKRSREIWARIEDELSPVSVEGREAWILRKDRSALERAGFAATRVRLLPYFDSYLMGHKERRHLVDAAHHKRVYRPAGWVYPTVLVNGEVAGEWSYERKGKRLQVQVRPYRPFAEEVKDLVRAEVADIARFLESPEARISFLKAR